uniref:Uncharacterized protein n=1 Tax=Tanacetum cinerariifolium TaxID=118510 RepID=A0A6L2NB08_TANCI|nr:hypothetical protein [Tanacetum cinerariifolium]
MFESPILVMDSGGRNHNRLLQAEPLDFWHLQDDGDLSGLGISRNHEGKKPSMTSLESSEGVILMPPNEGHMKLSKNVEPQWFLRKNTGIGPGAGSVAAKMKALVVSEAVSKMKSMINQYPNQMLKMMAWKSLTPQKPKIKFLQMRLSQE